MTWIPPEAEQLSLGPRRELVRSSVGHLVPWLHRFLADDGPGGVVLLGAFGSGKTTISTALGEAGALVVPLRLLVRGGSFEERWEQAVGDPEAVKQGRPIVLDGLDEVARPGEGGFAGFFERVTSLAKRWVLTSRPGVFRTDASLPAPHQVDSLKRRELTTLRILPLHADAVAEALGCRPAPEVCASPILLRLCLESELRRPCHPAEVVEHYLRFLGADIPRLIEAGWAAYQDRGLSEESASFPADAGSHVLSGQPVDRLCVADADGRLRFGHRSLYDYLVARYLVPHLETQGAPNLATGLAISEAMRVFLANSVQEPRWDHDEGWVTVPAGNYVSGGDFHSDERPLAIRHLEAPVRIARRPVSEADVAAWLEAIGPRPKSANFLRHWLGGAPRPGTMDHPAQHLRPSDCDDYAAWSDARLPDADEWEKAVRGIGGRRFPWGDHLDPSLANVSETGLDTAQALGTMPPQGPGELLSACGDVFEVTSSYYRGRRSRGRVCMGGSFAHAGETARCSLRLSHTLSGNLRTGLRLARDPQ